ncbi:hypothetical protein CRV08_10435 [Halarcobacter ebronensis]|uniref:Uncharacterized protein n=1 Tax=Halarcobacter ebronensis TaxID=1462615 RepID=A0A4Q0YAL7_9BACT|nr:hypothetical protein CRV08_10435 [Halarcobacter ebronensis]
MVIVVVFLPDSFLDFSKLILESRFHFNKKLLIQMAINKIIIEIIKIKKALKKSLFLNRDKVIVK